jgi:hypothetical protein
MRNRQGGGNVTAPPAAGLARIRDAASRGRGGPAPPRRLFAFLRFLLRRLLGRRRDQLIQVDRADLLALLPFLPFLRWPAPRAVPAVAAQRLRRRADLAAPRVRSHRRFVPTFVHFIPDFLRDSVPLFLKRQCDRTLAAPRAAVAFRRGRRHRLCARSRAGGQLGAGVRLDAPLADPAPPRALARGRLLRPFPQPQNPTNYVCP